MTSVKDKPKNNIRKTGKPSLRDVVNKKSIQSSLDASHLLDILKTKAHRQKIPASKQGVPQGWRKVTVVMRDVHHEKLKDISYQEKILIKDIIDGLLGQFLSSIKTKS